MSSEHQQEMRAGRRFKESEDAQFDAAFEPSSTYDNDSETYGSEAWSGRIVKSSELAGVHRPEPEGSADRIVKSSELGGSQGYDQSEPDYDLGGGRQFERQRKYGRRSLLREFLELVIILALALVIVTLLRTFVIDQYQIPTSSMEPTIMGNEQVKDHIFAEKISYHFNMPAPGDIVTFNDPTQDGRILIKRCVAVGGQTIDLDEQGGVLIDGKPLSEPYTHGKPTEPLEEMPGVSISYPYTIPANCIWVMGDNRTNSLDSRYFGPVEQDELVGKALFRSWPLDRFGAIE